MTDFSDRLRGKLDSLRKLDLQRTLPGGTVASDRVCEVNGRTYLNFSSNDYLALSGDPEVAERARAALDQYGAGAGGSRLICGNHPLYRQLEEALADWKNRSTAVVFGSGYLTNLGVTRAVTTGRDLVVHDELAHRCLIEGARLADADVNSFQHNDPDALDELLSRCRSEYDAVLVAVEGIYSMDGDRVPLEKFANVADQHNAWMLVDEAHSAGVWGPGGAGLTVEVEDTVELAMGTLSKAFGGYGGYVAGGEELKPFLVNRATSLIYSTGLPPSVIGANIAALEVIRSDPERRSRLKERVDQIMAWLDRRGIPRPEPPSQVIPIITGGEEETIEAGEYLQSEGVYAVPIRYPTVPRNRGRIRLSLRADHRPGDIEQLTEVLVRLDERGLIKRRNIWTPDTAAPANPGEDQ